MLLVGRAHRRAIGLTGIQANKVQQQYQRLRAFSALAPTSKAAEITPPFRPVDTRKGVSVVGAGRMGHIRAQGVASNPGTFLASVVDPDEDKARALAELASVPAFWCVRLLLLLNRLERMARCERTTVGVCCVCEPSVSPGYSRPVLFGGATSTIIHCCYYGCVRMFLASLPCSRLYY